MAAFLDSMTIALSIRGNLSIASSLMLIGRFSTQLTCTALLFTIASLFVRRVLPSALSNVVAPELLVFSAS